MRWIPMVLFWVAALSLQAQVKLPPGGLELLPADAIEGKKVFNPGSLEGRPVASAELVDAEGPNISKALRVNLLQPGGVFYNGAIHLPVPHAVKKGDVLLAHLFFRTIESEDETGQSFATVFVQGPPKSYKKYLVREIQAGKEWREILLPFEVTDDLKAGRLSFLIGVGGGSKPQIWEVGGINLLNYGQDARLDELPLTRATYGGRDMDASWRQAAAERIEQHRKGDFTIKIIDAAGNPMEGVKIQLRLSKHAYHFGTAISVSNLMGESDDNARYREVLLEYFNQSGPENALKWPPWAGDWQSRWNQETTIAALKWLQDRGFYIRGHVMVWPSREHLPKSLQTLMPSDPKQANPILRGKVIEHIADIAQKTAPYVREWDVINEPYTNHYLMDAFGDEVMVEWFKEARQHLPEQGLYLNDFSILTSQGRDLNHQQHYEKTLRFLKDSDAPLTGMGMQGHFGETPTDIDRVYEILEYFHKEFPDLDIRITEFDVDTRDEQLQADYTRDFLTIVFSHPATVGVQLWGFWEGAHWRPNAAMFDKSWRAKPNAEVWRRLIKDVWWTELSGKTDAAGEFPGRGFYGQYEVQIDGHAGEFMFNLEKQNTASDPIIIQLSP